MMQNEREAVQGRDGIGKQCRDGRGGQVLGITGGAGAGKSLLLNHLRETYGANVIVCDRVAEELQAPGGPCCGPMIALLGDDVVREDGTFDRAKIAAMVFHDEKMLRDLNAIVHPAVMEEVKRRIALSEGRLTVIESALLLEAGYREICDEVWYVYARDDIRAARLAAGRGYTKERIRAVFAAQKDDAFYREQCDYVIDNTDGPDSMYEQADRGLREHGFMYDRQREQW